MKGVLNLLRMAKRQGPLAAWRAGRHRLTERFYEWWFRVETQAEVSSEELGFSQSEFHFYAATDYASLFRVLKRVIPVGEGGVFLDYGSGKGRALIVAAASGKFRRVFGVEISGDLATVARRNVEAARKRLKCQEVEVVVGGADRYEVPAEVTHAYFCNPFHGSILRESFRRLQESVCRSPRQVTIICRLPEMSAMERELPGYPFFSTRKEFVFSREIRYWIFTMDEATSPI